MFIGIEYICPILSQPLSPPQQFFLPIEEGQRPPIHFFLPIEEGQGSPMHLVLPIEQRLGPPMHVMGSVDLLLVIGSPLIRTPVILCATRERKPANPAYSGRGERTFQVDSVLSYCRADQMAPATPARITPPMTTQASAGTSAAPVPGSVIVPCPSVRANYSSDVALHPCASTPTAGTWQKVQESYRTYDRLMASTGLLVFRWPAR
jgi:hypothetical protein